MTCWANPNQWNLTLFNSHPHKEDDVFLFLFLFTRIFSTHILTRRMTNWGTWGCWRIRFSTHILTRRMTKSSNDNLCPYCFSTHILTRRMTQVDAILFLMESFQLTSSQGGWRIHWMKTRRYNFFNSHPHKEDDDIPNHNPFNTEAFQLTSSQGGCQAQRVYFW